AGAVHVGAIDIEHDHVHHHAAEMFERLPAEPALVGGGVLSEVRVGAVVARQRLRERQHECRTGMGPTWLRWPRGHVAVTHDGHGAHAATTAANRSGTSLSRAACAVS